MGIAKTDLREF